MKFPIYGFAVGMVIGVIVLAAGKKPVTRWSIDEGNLQNSWKLKNGWITNRAGEPIAPRLIDLQAGYHLGVGTNRFLVELGFRDDGVVVWRRR